METDYDVIVIGLGAMGSATLYQLSKTGQKVLGIDQFSPPHKKGSSHGDTRFTRLGTGEGRAYFPLAKRSHEIWAELEKKRGQKLFEPVGGLIMESADAVDPLHGENAFMRIAGEVARENSIAHEFLDATAIQLQFPQFKLVGTESGYYEPGAGYLNPEACITAQMDEAQENGARLNTGEKLLSYEDKDSLVNIVTDKGSYTTKKLVITAGPWIGELVPELKSKLKVCRQVLYWFGFDDAQAYEHFKDIPVFAWAFGNEFMYGFPAIDGPEGGLKVATEQFNEETDPDTVSREVSKVEIQEMYEKRVKDRLPGVSSKLLKSSACMYTVTSDANFIIDVHPKDKNVFVASPCSGHGFKNSAAIGEVLSQLATHGKSDIDISAFSLKRFR